MGDIVELTGNESGNQPLHVAVSASAVTFQVRGHKAELRLQQSSHNNICKISLSANGECEICYGGIRVTGARSVLSVEEWRELWVTWRRGSVSIGRAGQAAFLTVPLEEQTEAFRFVVPSLMNGTQWRFELGPVRPASKKVYVSGGEATWVAAGDVLPLGALIGGHEREPLYIMRAEHEGSLTPGKMVPSEGLGYVPWGGQAHPKKPLEVLVGYNVEWVETRGNSIPPAAVLGGYSEVRREPLYIGRAEIDGHLIVGKVQPSHRVLYIPYQSREIAQERYEILVHSVKPDPRIIHLYQRTNLMRTLEIRQRDPSHMLLNYLHY